jgi:hypothetical protein
LLGIITLNSIAVFHTLVHDIIYIVPSSLLPWLGVPTTHVTISPASKDSVSCDKSRTRQPLHFERLTYVVPAQVLDMAPRDPGCGASPTPSSSGRGGSGRAETPATSTMMTWPDRVKMPMPDNYDSSRAKLKAFIMQCELYTSFNKQMFIGDAQKIL